MLIALRTHLAVWTVIAAGVLLPGVGRATAQEITGNVPARGSLLVVLRWGPEYQAPASPAPRLEIRWNWNDMVAKIDTVVGFVDSITVAAPQPEKPDTLVVALWPIAEGPPLLRRLEVLDATALARGNGGVLPSTLALDVHARSLPGSEKLPTTNPVGDMLSVDFDDSSKLKLDCGGDTCSFPHQPWRKHDYVATGGVAGTGAIRMHWYTGMEVEYSPVWIHAPPARHFRIRYAVRQSAIMRHQGSAVKLLRIRSGDHIVGTLESKQGEFVWFWDSWYEGAMVAASSLGRRVFSDNRWHVYEIEVDYRNMRALIVRFWFDGMPAKTVRRSAATDWMADDLIISPFVEMYSCGPPSCGASVNTGDYVVDDFSLTPFP